MSMAFEDYANEIAGEGIPDPGAFLLRVPQSAATVMISRNIRSK